MCTHAPDREHPNPTQNGCPYSEHRCPYSEHRCPYSEHRCPYSEHRIYRFKRGKTTVVPKSNHRGAKIEPRWFYNAFIMYNDAKKQLTCFPFKLTYRSNRRFQSGGYFFIRHFATAYQSACFHDFSRFIQPKSKIRDLCGWILGPLWLDFGTSVVRF